MNIMCWPHKWTVKDKEILPSMLEQMGEYGYKMKGCPADPSRKPCIVTYACTKCGAEKVVRL